MPGAGIDFATQIRRVQRVVTERAGRVQQTRAIGARACARRHGLNERGQGRPEVIVGERVAAELGKPPASSAARVLTTREPDLLEDGRIRCLGGPLAERTPARGPWGYAQLILLALGDGEPDPFGLATTGSLSARLPGIMSRASGGRLWLRFSHALLATGFGLPDLGAVLAAAYRLDHPGLRAVEVVLVAADADALGALEPVVAEAGVLSGQQRKLSLVGDGELICEDLDCDNCDHKPICDLLEDVRVRCRERRTG